MSDTEKYEQVDQTILKTIDLVREELGSCTAAQVANRMRMSRSMVIDRCRSMRERGLVSWTPLAGSLRRVSDSRHRLYDLIVQRAVEGMADLIDADTGQSVTAWCHDVVAMATATAWPELIPPGADQEGELTTPPATEQDVATSPAIRCEPCDRDFQTAQALAGHQRSKAHLARVS